MNRNLDPSRAELWARVVEADDVACNGGWQDSDCKWCRWVVETLRGGSIHCPECGHVNVIGHSCSDWKEYDDGLIDLDDELMLAECSGEPRQSGTNHVADLNPFAFELDSTRLQTHHIKEIADEAVQSFGLLLNGQE